jgi:hypothetical protein
MVGLLGVSSGAAGLGKGPGCESRELVCARITRPGQTLHHEHLQHPRSTNLQTSSKEAHTGHQITNTRLSSSGIRGWGTVERRRRGLRGVGVSMIIIRRKSLLEGAIRTYPLIAAQNKEFISLCPTRKTTLLAIPGFFLGVLFEDGSPTNSDNFANLVSKKLSHLYSDTRVHRIGKTSHNNYYSQPWRRLLRVQSKTSFYGVGAENQTR